MHVALQDPGAGARGPCSDDTMAQSRDDGPMFCQVHVLHDKIRVLDHVDMLLPDGAASEQILDTIKASGVETQVLAQDVNR